MKLEERRDKQERVRMEMGVAQNLVQLQRMAQGKATGYSRLKSKGSRKFSTIQDTVTTE